MRDEQIRYEVFEKDRPSFLPSYLMSAFVLVGIIMLLRSDLPLWPPQIAHLFFAVWFGCLFVWMLHNARERTGFSSHRLVVTSEVFRHSYRYAIAEKGTTEISLKEIETIEIRRKEPKLIEVRAKKDHDLYFLPDDTDIDALITAMRKVNPSIRVVETDPH